MTSPQSDPEGFKKEAAEPMPILLKQFWDFLRSNKKWWLTPIILVLMLFGGLLLLSSTAMAPLIYTLF